MLGFREQITKSGWSLNLSNQPLKISEVGRYLVLFLGLDDRKETLANLSASKTEHYTKSTMPKRLVL